MRAKTIKAVLAKKHKELVNSIEDERVRKLVDKNSIVTGGCIVSMLLGEKVHDYDYYFTDFETAMAVTQYYVKKFREAHPKENVEVKEDGGRIRIWIQSQGMAGEDTDHDEYHYFEGDADPSNAESFVDKAVEAMKQDDDGKPPYRPVFLTSNAITLSDKVQFIIRFYGSPEEIHKNYDFVHCTNYWTSKDGKLTLPAEALEAILAKELVYRGSKYPIASIIRTRKFINRGWIINAGQYLKMCMQISELNLKDPRILEDQLVGVDFAYFQAIIKYLYERKDKDKDFEITAAYICEIVDRIF